MMTNVTITTGVEMKDGNAKAKLLSPYHPKLPEKARQIGGSFSRDSKAWYFDERNVPMVRAMCDEIFGIDPLADGEPDLVDVRFNLYEATGAQQGAFLMGREIAHRPRRDSSVRTGEGVVVLSGGFPRSGGSAKYPLLHEEKDTVVLVRDVPRAMAEKFVEEENGEVVEQAQGEGQDPVARLLRQIESLAANQRTDLMERLEEKYGEQ